MESGLEDKVSKKYLQIRTDCVHHWKKYQCYTFLNMPAVRNYSMLKRRYNARSLIVL